MFPFWSEDSKTRKWNNPNRKWNYSNRIWNYWNRKLNYFSNFQVSDQKNSFTKCFPFGLRNLKWVLESGNEIIHIGMEIGTSVGAFPDAERSGKNFGPLCGAKRELSCHCFHWLSRCCCSVVLLLFCCCCNAINNLIEGEVLLDWNSVCKINSQK